MCEKFPTFTKHNWKQELEDNLEFLTDRFTSGRISQHVLLDGILEALCIIQEIIAPIPLPPETEASK